MIDCERSEDVDTRSNRRSNRPHRRNAGTGALEPRGPARFIAEPAAVGLAGFALTTMTLGVVNVGLVPKTVLPVVFGLALAYGGVMQLLASFGVAWSVNAVLGTLVVAYALLAIGKATGSTGVYHAGGAFTMATAACAWYTAAALTLEKVFGRQVLPIGSLRKVQQDVPGA